MGNVSALQSTGSSRDRRKKFVELATKRVNRALNDLRLIGNLSNKAAYEYSEEDVKKITRALQKEVDHLKAKFSGPDGASDSEFKL